MRLTKKRLKRLIESEVKKYLTEESIKLDVLSDEDAEHVETFLDKLDIGYDRDGTLYTIHIKDDTLSSSKILSRISAIADFDKID